MEITLAVLFPALAACSYVGTARDSSPEELDRERGWLAARRVPFIRHTAKEECGAAALAMVLSAWGVPTQIEQFVAARRFSAPRDAKEGV